MNTLPKILIVDDEDSFCQDIAQFLRNRGYIVVISNCAKDALFKVATEKPHLILLDIHMPEIDGVECLRRILEIDSEVLVIMVTCVTDTNTAKKAMELGAVDYITKPFSLESLEMAITAYLFLKSSK